MVILNELKNPAFWLGFLLEQKSLFDTYGYMLEFKQNDTAVAIILTLTELVTLSAPNFLFFFTHVTTKDQVVFIKLDSEDESEYPQRYNQFTINPSELFAGKNSGEWHYAVYEQESASNLDPALAGAPVEYGKMILDRSVDFAFQIYQTPTTYKAYNG